MAFNLFPTTSTAPITQPLTGTFAPASDNMMYAGGPSGIPGISGHDWVNNPAYSSALGAFRTPASPFTIAPFTAAQGNMDDEQYGNLQKENRLALENLANVRSWETGENQGWQATANTAGRPGFDSFLQQLQDSGRVEMRNGIPYMVGTADNTAMDEYYKNYFTALPKSRNIGPASMLSSRGLGILPDNVTSKMDQWDVGYQAASRGYGPLVASAALMAGAPALAGAGAGAVGAGGAAAGADAGFTAAGASEIGSGFAGGAGTTVGDALLGTAPSVATSVPTAGAGVSPGSSSVLGGAGGTGYVGTGELGTGLSGVGVNTATVGGSSLPALATGTGTIVPGAAAALGAGGAPLAAIGGGAMAGSSLWSTLSTPANLNTLIKAGGGLYDLYNQAQQRGDVREAQRIMQQAFERSDPFAAARTGAGAQYMQWQQDPMSYMSSPLAQMQIDQLNKAARAKQAQLGQTWSIGEDGGIQGSGIGAVDFAKQLQTNLASQYETALTNRATQAGMNLFPNMQALSQLGEMIDRTGTARARQGESIGSVIGSIPKIVEIGKSIYDWF